MKIRTHLLSAVVAILISPSGYADHTADAAKVLEFYRTENYLEEVEPCMEKHVKLLSKDLKISSNQQKKMLSLIKRIYPAENLYKIFQEYFATNYTAEKIAWKLNFINSVEGIKLRQAYAAAFKAGKISRQGFYEKNAKTLLSPNRKNAIMTFVTSTEQDRAAALMNSRCYFSIALAQNAFFSPKDKLSLRQLREKADNRETSYIEDARKKYEVFDFFLLKDYKINEVDGLSSFYTSANGQAFTKAFKKSLKSTMDAAANTFSSQLQKK